MKQKHWQVSVFDKTSESIRDDTFYTTDTEVYLIFELIDKDFTPDTATVTVYNVNGKATINVNVDVSGGIVNYEIPEEAIGHGGVWRTQVIFTKDDEDYTTGIINFDVSGHLLDNTKQKLVAITNWNRFIKHAKGLIDDWEQLEEIRQANEQQRELAESVRQNEFETNETERESTFVVSESVRQVNEQARESAESMRVANEEERELNEAERISKDSERDSKIDSKADKFYVDNQDAALTTQLAEKANQATTYNKTEVDNALALKANKTQEAWITPTLLNGWVDVSTGVNFQYRKNTLGDLEFRGGLKSGVAGTIACALPFGFFLPNRTLYIDLVSSFNLQGFAYINTSGNMIISHYTTNVIFDGKKVSLT